MTDKQIKEVFKNGFYCIEPCPEIKELQAELKRKEQECDRWKEQIKFQNNFIDSLLKATNNSEWFDKSILDDEASEIIEKIELDYEQLDQLKAKNKKVEEMWITQVEIGKNWYERFNKLKQTLTEIKEVLQFYNNTTIGIDKGNGKFEFEVCNDNVLGGKLIYCYNTNPAKQALQKISEVEND